LPGGTAVDIFEHFRELEACGYVVTFAVMDASLRAGLASAKACEVLRETRQVFGSGEKKKRSRKNVEKGRKCRNVKARVARICGVLRKRKPSRGRD
jgi:hypothetical protein